MVRAAVLPCWRSCMLAIVGSFSVFPAFVAGLVVLLGVATPALGLTGLGVGPRWNAEPVTGPMV